MKNKRIWPMLAAALVVILGVVFLLTTCARPEQPGGVVQRLPVKDPGETAGPQQTRPTEPAETDPPAKETTPTETEPTSPGDLIELETPYCSLYFPLMWEDLLYIEPVEERGYRMKFGCRLEPDRVFPLFDVSFGEIAGTPLGSVEGPDGTPETVSIRFYDPAQELAGGELETFCAMQEDANRLIELLPLTEGGARESWEDVPVETPFCTLTFPGAWEEYLLVEHEGGETYTLNFFARFDGAERIHLFALRFCVSEADAALTFAADDGNSVGVAVELFELSQLELTPSQLDTAYGMQDAVNDLMEQLSARTVE